MIAAPNSDTFRQLLITHLNILIITTHFKRLAHPGWRNSSREEPQQHQCEYLLVLWFLGTMKVEANSSVYRKQTSLLPDRHSPP